MLLTCPLLLLALGVREYAPPLVGRAAIVVLLAGALVTLWRGRRDVALALGLASYLLVSRNWEVAPALGTLFVADVLGRALAPEEDTTPGSLLLAVGFCFCLFFVQRIILGGALDFGGMDFGAGGFGDKHVPAWLVGIALSYKYISLGALGLVAFVGPQARRLRPRLLSALYLAYLARAATLTLMLFFCGSSYWTGLRVLGDLPFAFIGGTTVLLCWIGAQLSSSSRSSSS